MLINQTTTYPEIESLTKPPKKLIVFIHGLGSDGHDLISLAPLMQPQLPDCYFFSPHGIEAFDMAPFGRQWFSLNDRDPAKIKQLIINNTPLLAAIIQEQQQQLNLSNKDTILVGFSQGMMIGIYLNLMQTEPFYCTVGFSGRLVAPDQCLNKQTPICIIHGEQDDIADVSELTTAAAYLRKQQIKHRTLIVPDLAHSIDQNGLEFAIEFIKNPYL